MAESFRPRRPIQLAVPFSPMMRVCSCRPPPSRRLVCVRPSVRSMEGGSMSTVPTAQALIRVHIRWMIRRDMPEVLAIEHASYEFPWCEEEFLRVLRQRNCIGMVAEYGERVVGFMIYELYKNKLQILDFAVHPEFRRQSVGRQMVVKLVSKLSSHRRTRITLSIRESN